MTKSGNFYSCSEMTMQFKQTKVNESIIFILQKPVVQSIVSLTNSLRGILVKCFFDFKTKYTDIFVEQMRAVFALQKLLTFF